MPTAARLVAAILLAALAWLLSDLIRPMFPEGTPFGRFNYINAIIGLCVGWSVIGSRAGRGTVPGINNGLTGVAVLLFWGLAFHSCVEMFKLAMRNRYDGPLEAFTQIFLIGAEFALEVSSAAFLAAAVAGALIVGLSAEFASRHWR